LLREGLGPLAVLQLLPYVLPVSLQYAVPATALFAVCCVYGRMTADGEVSTVKAVGISPLRLVKPALIASALLSPISVAVSDLAVSWGRPGINHVVLLSIEQIAYRFLRSQSSYGKEQYGFSITVQDVDGKRLIRPRVKVRQGNGGESVELTASEGSLRLDSDSQALLLKVTDSYLEGGTGLQGIVPGETEFRIPLGKALQEKSASEQSPSQLSLQMISSEAIQQDRRTHEAIGHLAAHTGFALLTARWQEIAGPTGKHYESQIDRSRARLARLHTEPWRRWAEGFSCFCFVLVGAPLAMLAKTADYWTTFGMCFLPTLVVYYPLFIFGLDQAKAGAMPPYAVWMGNVMLTAVGIALMARVRRF